MPTFASELVANAKSHVENLSAQELADELDHGDVVLVDLREQYEREVHGVIPGSAHIPRGILEFCADPALPIHAEQLDPRRRIVLYCALGNRSALAALTLEAIGFPNVAHLEAGFPSWRQAGGVIEPPRAAGDEPWARLLGGQHP